MALSLPLVMVSPGSPRNLSHFTSAHTHTHACTPHTQNPQAPMVRTSTYNQYGLDDYPLGTNAIVAVISYTVSALLCCGTVVLLSIILSHVFCFSGRLYYVLPWQYCFQGYDMEDAMILNKGSVERGFKHATVYKSEVGVAVGSFPIW